MIFVLRRCCNNNQLSLPPFGCLWKVLSWTFHYAENASERVKAFFFVELRGKIIKWFSMCSGADKKFIHWPRKGKYFSSIFMIELYGEGVELHGIVCTNHYNFTCHMQFEKIVHFSRNCHWWPNFITSMEIIGNQFSLSSFLNF